MLCIVTHGTISFGFGRKTVDMTRGWFGQATKCIRSFRHGLRVAVAVSCPRKRYAWRSEVGRDLL